MKKPSTKLVAVLAAALLVPVLALAGPGMAHPGADSAMGMLHHQLLSKLNLTPDQQAQIKTIFANHKSAAATSMTQRQQAHAQLMNVITSGTFDEAAVRTAAQAVAQQQVEDAVNHAKMFSEAWQVLNADQQATAKKLIADAQAKQQARIQRMQARQAAPAGQSNGNQ